MPNSLANRTTVRGPDAFELYRTDIPARSAEPPLAHNRPRGRWTLPGSFPSYRSGYSVSYWGPDHLQFLTLVEVNPAVRFIRARPETLEWFDGCKWIEHTPDFGVWTDHGWAYCDIAQPQSSSKVAARRTAALKTGVSRMGGHYRAISAAELRIEPRLSNSKQVNSCSAPGFPAEDANTVVRVMPRCGASDIREIASCAGMAEGEALAAVLNLVWHGILAVDMSLHLSFSTKVWKAGQ